MRIINVNEATYDMYTLYRNARTPAQRALLGFIVKGGLTHNPVFGGAFALLRGIERCNANEEIYQLVNCTPTEKLGKQIIYVAETALKGELDEFTLLPKEINQTIKSLSEYM